MRIAAWISGARPEPPGRCVGARGRQIHIVELAADGMPIVMLPGMGTDVPSADFLPLARLLNRADFRVLIVEPLGYGFSDATNLPRTLENVTEELHAALHAYGLRRDYILFGHSASGLTIRMWAARYPEEVAGVIGEDISVPEQFDQPELTRLLAVGGWMAALFAVSRFLGRMGVNRLLARCSAPLKRAAEGDAALLKRYRAAFVRSRRSDVLRMEYNAIVENGRTAAEFPLPRCPMLLLTACGRRSCEEIRCASGFSWCAAHRALAADAPAAENVELPGAHYLHYSHAEAMTAEITRFFGAKCAQGQKSARRSPSAAL